MSRQPHLLIINSPYYTEVNENLLKNTKAALDDAGASYEVRDAGRAGDPSGDQVRAKAGSLTVTLHWAVLSVGRPRTMTMFVLKAPMAFRFWPCKTVYASAMVF